MGQRGGSVAVVGARLRRNLPGSAGPPATALLVRDGVIEVVGTDEEVRAAAAASPAVPAVRVVDVRGATVTPGLFDSHTHPEWAASLTAGIDLGEVRTLDELRSVLHAEASRLDADGWVRGWNLDYEVFRGQAVTRDAVEDAVGGRPTILVFYDLHTGLATRAALEAAGIRGPVRFADTSQVVVDAQGAPTGELKEMTAFRRVLDAQPRPDLEEELDALRRMLLRLAAVGLTGGAVMDGTARTRSLLAELERRGQLAQRLTVHQWHAVHFTDDDLREVVAAKDERGRLWQGGAVKLFSDGVIDTGTALLHVPDACGEGRSAFWPDWERFREVVHAYDAAGMQIATHAVGDRAVSQVLDVYAGLPPRTPGPAHTIEHLEVLSDADVVELGRSGVTASMQPLHMQWRAADGGDNWSVRLGEQRSRTGYRTASVLRAGARLVLGSDWPVASYDPRIGMAWARHRGDARDPSAPVFEPDERLTGEQALLAYTLWPAQARGHADRGHLGVGAVGDLTVWADDPAVVPPSELVSLPVLLTVVDGVVVHDAGAPA